MRYETIRRLGRGGMGVVDLAVDEHGHEVALKRLSLHGTPEELENARQRIRREAETLQKLDHPGIVALRDLFDDGDDLVLVMDHLPGGNLAQRVGEHGVLAPSEIGPLADRLLDALSSAHRQGVVHRDIKPANVLFDADGQAALADFGVAIHRDATPGLTASEMVIGTPGFMSPEQARGEQATAASDVFSLGATIAFAATGQGPFGTADPRVLMLRAAAGRTERLPRDLPVDQRRRLAAMLDQDPARRPTAAAARGGPEGTRPHAVARARAVTRVVPRGRPRRIAAGAVAGVLLVGGAVAALASSGSSSGGPIASPTPPTTTTAASTTTTTALCEDLPYLRCGGDAAPHTTGRVCIVGYYDLDDNAANGCESSPDGLPANTVLVDQITANLVPADQVDRYVVEVNDNRNLGCDGRLKFELTAPNGAIQELTVQSADGSDELGRAVSSDGVPATVSLREPSCGGDDSTTLQVLVEAAPGSSPSGRDYTLTRSGNY